MKKITLFIMVMLLFGFTSNNFAQTLNQNAAWPNATWTVTGTFNVDPLAFESDPTTTANFAFDDDDAGTGSADDIAAESPVIDLTAAFTAGETSLFVNGNHVFNHIPNNDAFLGFQYWDADAAMWIDWGNTPFTADTPAPPTNNFCAGTKLAYTSDELFITGFTPNQLLNFQYRVFWDDDRNGGDGFEWGFCFESPTITSSLPSCNPVTNVVLDLVLDTSVQFSWTAPVIGIPVSYDWEIVPSGNDQGVGTVTTGSETPPDTNAVTTAALTASTPYDIYIVTDCGGAGTATFGPLAFTTLSGPPPANDECSGAITITQETSIPDAASATPTAGTLINAVISSVPTEDCTFFGADPTDDVWYKFTALTSVVNITFEINFDGVATLYESADGTCNTLTLVDCADATVNGMVVEEINAASLTIGTVYYTRIYNFVAAQPANGAFNVKIWSPTALSVNDVENQNAFTYYPNPVKNTLSLRAQNTIQNVSIYNVLGQEVIRTSPNAIENDVNMSSLQTGTYIMNVTINNVTKTVRIIKQ